MRLVPLQDVGVQAIVGLWCEFLPNELSIDESLFRDKVLDSPLLNPEASLAAVDDERLVGFAVVKSSPTPSLYEGSATDQAHLNSIAWSAPAAGSMLLEHVRTVLKRQGKVRLVFGQDSGHFFPGCPESCEALKSGLAAAGFQAGEKTFDVGADLTRYVSPTRLPEETEFRLLKDSDLPDLDRFLEREFSPRWRYDTMTMSSIEGPHTVAGLYVEGEFSGFALLQTWETTEPIGGGVWHCALGDHWGALGPIGVAKHLQGRGLGTAFLGASLACLRDSGVRNCIIDWTGLVDFYGKHGFKICHVYRGMTLEIL